MKVGMGQNYYYHGNHAQLEFITKCYSVIKWERLVHAVITLFQVWSSPHLIIPIEGSVIIPTPNHPHGK
jgi:hypothetical protein